MSNTRIEEMHEDFLVSVRKQTEDPTTRPSKELKKIIDAVFYAVDKQLIKIQNNLVINECEPTEKYIWVGEDKKEDFLNQEICELKLPEYTNNGLKGAGILFIKDLLRLPQRELTHLPKIGKKSLFKIKQQLIYYGLELGGR